VAIATKNPIIEASSQDCCPLCSKDRYCGLIKDEAGKTYKVVCQWTDALLVPEGWKYTGLAKDGRGILRVPTAPTTSHVKVKNTLSKSSSTPEQKS
jgi:hypothetical protein